MLTGRSLLLLLFVLCLESCGDDDRSVSPGRLAVIQENPETSCDVSAPASSGGIAGLVERLRANPDIIGLVRYGRRKIGDDS